MSIVCDGDEVVSFDPCWPGIINLTKVAGGILKTVPLNMTKNSETKTISWDYDWEKLSDALTDKTKAIILTNPHSPSGRTFSEHDLEVLTGNGIKFHSSMALL